MAKKDKKKSKKDNKPADAVGAVRTAVERTFQATADSAQSTRTRAQDLVDEVAGAAGRVREMIEDIRVLEDLKRLRTEVETLTRRVAALEDKPAAAKPARSSAAARRRARPPRSARPRPRRRPAPRARPRSRARRAAKPRSTAAKSRSTTAKSGSTATKSGTTAASPVDGCQAALRGGQEARLLLMASPQFASDAEFREVMDQIFAMMSDDPEMGPALRDADTPQRFEFDDLDMVVNIRAGEAGEGNLHWEWSDDVSWEPKVRMKMSSETANKYFQGKENVAVAIARRRIKTGGDVKAALSLIPITKPVYARYRALVESDYPHLKV